MKPAWFPDWSGQAAAIVASGGSANAADVALLRGRVRVAVVNRSWELAPWADLLYGADARFWHCYPAAREFAGLRVSADADVPKQWGVQTVTVRGEHAMLTETPGTIGHGGNSGFQAVNLVAQFGAPVLLLLGLDYRGEHWHPAHPAPLRNPRPQSFDKWRARLDAQAARLRALGVMVINCSPTSALTAYEKMPVADALAQFGAAERAAA